MRAEARPEMNCPHCVTRRGFVLGSAGFWLAGNLAAARGQEVARRKAEHCILVWLDGGPSHLDTFDPKPGTPSGGPVQAIDTAVAGLKLSAALPRLAEQMRAVSLVRSLTSREEDHDRAWTYLHTGNPPQETVSFPSLGAIVSAEKAPPADGLPSFVHVGEDRQMPAGFLGVAHQPFRVAEPGGELGNLVLPEHLAGARKDRRVRLLRRMNERFGPTEQAKVQEAALRFLESGTAASFRLDEEPADLRQAYGDSAVGRGCLLARRLVERGVRFVEVAHGGWDTHENNFDQTAALCGQLDPALATLVRDLNEKELLHKTLVLCMGEFGRTPQINPQNGRDHWARAFAAAVAGGGVAGGRVIGATDAGGFEVAQRPVSIPDLFATVFSAFGLDPRKAYRTPEGRPIRLVEGGKPVEELFA
jgi:hypothetical protein